MRTFEKWFSKAARTIAEATGSVWAVLASTLLIIGWLASGPIFNYSSDWQLIINTGTTIITFIMVFIIQNATNREMKEQRILLEALMAALKEAPTKLAAVETLSDEELKQVDNELTEAAHREATGG